MEGAADLDLGFGGVPQCLLEVRVSIGAITIEEHPCFVGISVAANRGQGSRRNQPVFPAYRLDAERLPVPSP